jgi:histidine phosphotransferase ChpT
MKSPPRRSNFPRGRSRLHVLAAKDANMTVLSLDALDLAALLCSRVCHDVISPVGAIVNGLEVLDEEKDAEMRGFALDLIKKSAETASARLQFCRLAFGAAGSAGASIDTGDAEKVARGLFADQRTQLDWRAPRLLMPKNQVKLILNLCLIAAGAIPRGGVITVATSEDLEPMRIAVTAKGVNAKLSGQTPKLLAGTPDQPVDGQGIQAYYTRLIAKAAQMELHVAATGDLVALEAVAVEASALVEAVS